jgi:hypothetical protein
MTLLLLCRSAALSLALSASIMLAPTAALLCSSPLDLGSLNGVNGFVVNGVTGAGHNSGGSVSAVGDVNGDGIGDVIIGAADANSLNGQAFVVFGTHATRPSTFNLSSLNGTNGFVLNGLIENVWADSPVSAAGDVNGDGIGDIIIGAPGASSGVTYVVFGSKSAWPSSFDLASLNGINGFVLNGSSVVGAVSSAVSSAGDVNGDGIGDILVGAPLGNSFPGVTYVVFGSKSAFPSSISLGSLNGTNGFTLIGENVNDLSGCAVSSAGDFNGDGIGDILIGALNAGDGNLGKAYVVFGSISAWPSSFNLTSLNGNNGFSFVGQSSDDGCGGSVAAAGDVNGDGVGDILIGCSGINSYAVKTYVVFGSTSMFPSSLYPGSLNGTNGFALVGENSNNYSGSAVATAGDFNNDGFGDVIVGDFGVNSDTGRSYVVFGSDAAWPSSLNLASLNGANGFIINGENSGDFSGISLSAGDVNGDNFTDLIIGASGANSYAGKSYVVFGPHTTLTSCSPTGSPSKSPTQPGTSAPTNSAHANSGSLVVVGIVGALFLVWGV